MAYDPGLAQRIRDVLAHRSGITERKMFGGLAFMLHGHMLVGVLGTALMARVGPGQYSLALALKHVRPMDFTGRPMAGYVFVDEQGLVEDDALQVWLSWSQDFVYSLPVKVGR